MIISIQSARDFLTKVAKDEEFRKRLGGCKTRADQYHLAQGAGFEFTGDEMRSAAGELQDADLEVISGGSSPGFTVWGGSCCSHERASGFDPMG
jgi:predicted ribosomally synthesized peptide with nif11-like leader